MESRQPESTLRPLSPERFIQGMRDYHGRDKFVEIVREARKARVSAFQKDQIVFCKKYNVPYSYPTDLGVEPLFQSPTFYALCDVTDVPAGTGFSAPPPQV